jgi:drug/metabolite transporter (DMT)-like permease
MKKSSPLVYIYTLSAMLFWGLSFVWVKITYEYYHPLTVVFLRLALSSILLWIIARFMAPGENIKKGDKRYFLLLAFFEPFCYFLAESFGLKLVSAAVGSIIIATIPVFTPLAAYFILREKVSWGTLAGLVISFFGVGLIVLNQGFGIAVSGTGVLLMFLAVVSAVFYGLLLKKVSHKYSALTVVKYQNVIGLLLFLPLFLIFDWGHFSGVRPDLRVISTLAMLAVFPSSLAFVFITIGVRQLGISRVNLFTNFIPVSTAVFAYLLLGERFNALKLAGMAAVIAGLLLSELTSRRKETGEIIPRHDG